MDTRTWVIIIVVILIIALYGLAANAERIDQHCFYNSSYNQKNCSTYIIEPEEGDDINTLIEKLYLGSDFFSKYYVTWRRTFMVSVTIVVIIAIVFYFLKILPFKENFGAYLIILALVFFGVYGLQNFQDNHNLQPIMIEIGKTVRALEQTI